MEMTLTDKLGIHPRLRIRLFLLVFSFTFCELCSRATSTVELFPTRHRTTTAVPTTTTEVPTAASPSDVTVQSWTNATIEVGWIHEGSNTAHYEIKAICISAGTCRDGAESVSPTKRSGTVYDLTAGAEYEIIVTAVNAIGQGNPSAPVNKRTDPNTVEALVVSSPGRSTHSIQGSWTIPEGLISSYRIECISSTGGNPHLAEDLHPSTTGYVCTGLSAGHLYTMSVYTVSGTGNDDDKLESEPASEDKQVYPNTVVALEVSSPDRSTKSIQGSWTIPEGLISSYRIECISSTGGTPHFVEDLDSDITVYMCTGLSAGHLYTMSVYTVSGTGNDDDKLESEPASEDKRVYPYTVVAFGVSSPDRSTNSIQGIWIGPDGLISSYRIECISSTGGTPHLVADLDSDTTEYNCTGLSAGHLYTMSVYTVSGTGNDDKLESEPASEDKRVYPHTVTMFNVASPDKSTNSIHGSWSRPDGLISSYRIECTSSTGGTPHFVEDLYSDIIVYMCTGLTAGHLYTMSVYTVSGTGNDDDKLESEPASEDKRVYPHTVVAFGVSSHDRSTNSIQGIWTGPKGLISSYRIECISSTGGNPHLVEDLDSDVTEYNCTGLSAGHLYTMSVYTVSGTGNNDDKLKSEPASEDKRVYPEASNILTTATTPDSFAITWAKPDGYWTGYALTYDPMDNQQNAESGNEEISDPNQSITAHTFRGLFAGTEYSVDIFTISGEDGDVDPLYSDPATETDRTVPAMAKNVTSECVETDFVDIAWDIDVTSLYEEFTVNYMGQLDTRQHVQITKVTSTSLRDLLSGDTYTIEIYTHSHDKTSDSSVPVNVTTEPLGPGEVRVIGKNDEEIRIQWAAPDCNLGEDCNYDSYRVTHEPEHADVKQQSDLALNARLVGLNPGELYNITVQAVSGNAESKPETITDRTLPATPENFRVVDTTVASLLVQWDKPIGNFKSYNISVEYVNEERDKSPDNIKIHLPDKDDEYPTSNIIGLDPFTEYLVILTCLSPEPFRTESDPTYTQGETDIAPPPPSDKQPSSVPGVITTTQTTITVQFTYDFFTHDHGPVLYYSVIVTQDDVRGGYDDYEPERGTDPDPQMTTWAQAQGTIMRYQIDERYEYPWPYEDGGRSPYTIFITIGENTACDIGNDRENYCNGPLKEGTPYRYQFRGYTAGGYTDTKLSEPVYTAPDLTWLGILLCILGGLLLAILVILGIIYLLRKYPDAFKRKSDPSLTGNENPMPVVDGQEGNKKKRKRPKPVKLSKYKDYFKTMSADMEFRFSEEYEELRSIGRDQTCDVSELAKNKDKNRYANILPYDSTRVQLSILAGNENSDYINANWMPGYNSPKEFIAAQGPLPGTKDDFWRMIWEYDVRTIVMVTQCTERGKVKCDHYWPFDNEPVYYGAIQVNMLSEEVFPEWTVREINLENGGICKKVRHFNFTAWPDHGVPKATQALLYFVRAVREQMQDDSSPTVVHCSAGGGRTGTFIALDRLIQYMRDNDSVDIYGIVCEMRMHRMFMIQSESQYVFIHQCVADLLREERGDSEWFNVHTYGNVPPMRKAKPDAVANHGI